MFTKVRWDPHKPLDSQTQMQQQQPTQRQQQQLTQIYVDFFAVRRSSTFTLTTAQ